MNKILAIIGIVVFYLVICWMIPIALAIGKCPILIPVLVCHILIGSVIGFTLGIKYIYENH